MADIRYVVLSDLHFGADNSVLTSVLSEGGGRFQVDPTAPTPLLEGMVAGLRELTAGQSDRPTLILAGDVLDLALSPDEVAATAFEGFVDLAFAPADRLFAPVVYYLPGNHDHHLWETAREAQYVAALKGWPPGKALEAPWHTTRLLPERQPPVTPGLLSAVIGHRTGCGDVSVHVAYPNLALTAGGGRRCRVVSHGHFTEPIYTLMSHLRDLLFPDQRVPGAASIATLEEENFAWIDFFWSTLGRSGQVGVDVGLVYADLTSAAALDALVANLLAGLMAHGKGPAWLRPVETRVLCAIFKHEVNHLAKSERGTPDVALSARSQVGLRAYLGGPLAGQMRSDLGEVPPDVGFIWGHTHKPYVDTWAVDGYPNPVQILNTGGWVVDTAEAVDVQGGGAVLLDDDLNAVLVRFYNQTADGKPAPVKVLSAVAGNPLFDALAGAIDPAAEPWCSISAAAASLVSERHQLQVQVTAAKSP
ncbi:MAG TPA: hypothetical protein VG184_12325 [Acidimicrobiales bacterium]|nr:hypothetical protein [Acidimicrobiales bacterium]